MTHYIAIPKAGTGPGVVALHSWWGLNTFFRSLCDRLAEVGFVVLAPDLYDGKVATTVTAAKKLHLDRDSPRPGRQKPDLVQRFVDASIVGWYTYVYGDNSAGNAMIKKLNPDMNDELLAYCVAKMREHGIVDSGESIKNGIGAMTDERMASFFDKMVRAGVVKGTIDYRQGYTLRFVNKAVGVELRPKN